MNLINFFENIKAKIPIGIKIPRNVVLSRFFELVQTENGEILHQSGKICRIAIYIEKGVLRQYSFTDSGAERTYQIAMEGEWVSDLESFIEQQPSTRNIEVIEGGRIWIVTYEKFKGASQSIPFIDYFFNRLVKRITFKLQQQNAEIMEMTLEERYMKLMKEHPEYFQRVPLKILATYFGVEKQSLSRLRRRIQSNK